MLEVYCATNQAFTYFRGIQIIPFPQPYMLSLEPAQNLATDYSRKGSVRLIEGVLFIKKEASYATP